MYMDLTVNKEIFPSCQSNAYSLRLAGESEMDAGQAGKEDRKETEIERDNLKRKVNREMEKIKTRQKER